MRSLFSTLRGVQGASSWKQQSAVTRYALNNQAFMSSMMSEPENMVRSHVTVNARSVRIPYLTDGKKQEIYAKYVSDPQRWSLPALASYYQASLDRVKAVVHLMHERYEHMKGLGLQVSISGQSDDDKVPSVSVEIPAVWNALYDKHLMFPEHSLSKLLNDFNEAAKSEADKAHLNEEGLKKVLDNLKDHHRRLKNVASYESHMTTVLQKLKAKGVNVNFQEVPSLQSNERFQSTYFPQLINDDDFEYAKKDLLKRVQEETNAKVQHNVEYYEQKHQETKSTDISHLRTNKSDPSRWKLAFKELSSTATTDHSAHFKPTVIRTRSGDFRNATPLEEMKRSWNRKPKAVDVALAHKIAHLSEKYVQPHDNIDKDDHITAALASAKLEKRKKISPKNGGKK